ncbi:hypothetical protein CHCC20335_0437 [Bacillus paralicheniformis]|nr:hypothetical protein CHCC20335_0437 [Bacillus paralicheniformis]
MAAIVSMTFTSLFHSFIYYPHLPGHLPNIINSKKILL